MKGRRIIHIGTIAGLMLALLAGLAMAQAPAPSGAEPLAPLSTGFTYQGQLKSSATPYTGTCDFQFGLWDAFTGGTQIGGTLTQSNVGVAGGFFTVQLDYGAGAFQDQARWLAISVRCPAGGGIYTPLTPRQPLTPAPYALYATGNWSLTGNNGTTPGNYLGTNDNVALEVKVNGARALRIEPNSSSPNLLGGYNENWLAGGVFGATIGGGGASGYPNRVTDHYGTVGGGANNQAGDDAGTLEDGQGTTVGGGFSNIALSLGGTVGGGTNNRAGGERATVGGGGGNTASADHATVGGGDGNTASAGDATVGGGLDNTADGPIATIGGGFSNAASGNFTTVGGGQTNTADGSRATVGGGFSNAASGDYATVGGGFDSTASGNGATVSGGDYNEASGVNATVPGGEHNLAAGWKSFAAGSYAIAGHEGCFVWGDDTVDWVSCSAPNQFVARAKGGVYFYTHENLWTGAYLAAGGGSWAQISDRNLKENVTGVDAQQLLASLARVPVTTWNYTTQDPAIRHIGPMAQDFYAAFGVGEDNTHITTIDADGVALAAIQGLYAESQKLKAENHDQQERIDALEAENVDLNARLTALEQAVQGDRMVESGRLPVLWPVAGGLVIAGGALAGLRRKRGGAR